MPLSVFLVSLAVLALIAFILWFDYRRICRRDAQRFAASGRYQGRRRL